MTDNRTYYYDIYGKMVKQRKDLPNWGIEIVAVEIEEN